MIITRTEGEVLRLLMGGLTTQEIAQQRRISLNQVEEHVRNLRQKTGTKTLFELGYKVGRGPAPLVLAPRR